MTEFPPPLRGMLEAHRRTLRNPWWRFQRYLRLWAITMMIGVVCGWFTNGWNGIVVVCLFASALQAVAFTVWEYGERRRDREFRDEGLL